MIYWTDFGIILAPLVAIFAIGVLWIRRRKSKDIAYPTRHRDGASSKLDAATTCPICLRDNLSLPVQASCGHTYCGMCFIQYCNSKGSSCGVSCPYCTQKITLVSSAFSNDDLWDEKILEMLASINKYNRATSSSVCLPKSTSGCIRLLLRQLLVDFKRHCLSTRQRGFTVAIVVFIGTACILHSHELLMQIGGSFLPDLFWGTLSLVWFIPGTIIWMINNWASFVETVYWAIIAPFSFLLGYFLQRQQLLQQQQQQHQQQERLQQELFAKLLAPRVPHVP